MLRRSILIGISLGLIVMSGARAWGGFAARAVRFEPASGSASAPAAAALSFESSPFGFLPANVGQLPNPSYAEARDIGVHWDRPAKTMYWSEIQPDLNLEPNFSIADAGFAAIPAGINIVENVDVENHRNPVGYNRPGSYLPIDIVKYQAFVSAAVQRYDGDGVADAPNLHQPIKYWQVSNELSNNLSDFPQFQALTYNAIKAACADCKVLIGGVGGMPNGYLDNFGSVYAPIITALNGQYFDIFDFHWYGNATGDYRRIDEVLPTIRATLDAHGYASTPIWITEMGTYSGDPADNPPSQIWPFQTEEQQAGDLLKRYVHPQALGIEKIFSAFGLIEGWDNNNNYFNHTGLIYDGKDAYDRGNGVKKVGYFTYRLMTDKLEGSTYAGTVDGLPPYVYGYVFHRGTGPDAYVLWYDDFAGGTSTRDATLNVSAPSVVVTHAVTDQQGNIAVATLPVTDGSVALTLGQSPVFVESTGAVSVGGTARLPDAVPPPTSSDGRWLVAASSLVFVVLGAALAIGIARRGRGSE